MVVGIDNNVKFCISGKMTRFPFGNRTKTLLEIIHTDVCGPITPESYGGYKFFVTFIDDFSNFTVVYLIKKKSDVLEGFRYELSFLGRGYTYDQLCLSYNLGNVTPSL